MLTLILDALDSILFTPLNLILKTAALLHISGYCLDLLLFIMLFSYTIQIVQALIIKNSFSDSQDYRFRSGVASSHHDGGLRHASATSRCHLLSEYGCTAIWGLLYLMCAVFCRKISFRLVGKTEKPRRVSLLPLLYTNKIGKEKMRYYLLYILNIWQNL